MFEFICYGGSDIYQSVFSSLAMITGSNATSSLINLTMVLGLIVCMIMAMTDANIGHILKWFFTAFVIYGILWVPKVTVQVTDRLDPAYVTAPVANVPLGVGATASLISRVGDRVIQLTELAFSDPADAKYSKYGVVFGAKLMSRIKDARPTNQIFAANLNYYMTNCAIYDINDQTVKVQDLATTKDTWTVLTANPHPMRMTESIDGSGNLNMVSCSALVTILNTGFDATSDEALASITRSADPGTSAAFSLVKGSAVLDSYLSTIGETQQNARRVMRNAITRNGLSDAIAQSGQSGLLASLGEEMAHDQTKKTQGFLGAAGETAIPVLKIVVECLFIGIFPVIFPLFLMPKVGMKSAQMYLVGFFYLQLWGPMYVILHKIMMFYAYQKGFSATVSFGTPAGLNMMTINAVADANSDITALAGSMSLMIPVMAGLVTRGAMAVGAQGEALLGQFRSGAEAAGSMTATGNVSLANTNFETSAVMTSSQNLHTANQYRTRASVAAGGADVTTPDGTQVTLNDYGGISAINAPKTTMVGGVANLNTSQSLERNLSRTEQVTQSSNADRTFSRGETNAVLGSINTGTTYGRGSVLTQGRQSDEANSQSSSVANLYGQGITTGTTGKYDRSRDSTDTQSLSFGNRSSADFTMSPGRGVGGIPTAAADQIGTGAGTGDKTPAPVRPSLGGNLGHSFTLGEEFTGQHSKRQGYYYGQDNSKQFSYSDNFTRDFSNSLSDRSYGGSSFEISKRAERTIGTNVSHGTSDALTDTFSVGVNNSIQQQKGVSSGVSMNYGVSGDLTQAVFDWYSRDRAKHGDDWQTIAANWKEATSSPDGIAGLTNQYLGIQSGQTILQNAKETVTETPPMDFNVTVPTGPLDSLSAVGNSKAVNNAMSTGNLPDSVSTGIGKGAYQSANIGLSEPLDTPDLAVNKTGMVAEKVEEGAFDANNVVKPKVDRAQEQIGDMRKKTKE